jgi:hypothetical protein
MKNLKLIVDTISSAWPVLAGISFVIYTASSIYINQQVQAKKLDQMEQIQSHLQTIQIKIEVLDERIDQLVKQQK